MTILNCHLTVCALPNVVAVRHIAVHARYAGE